VFIILLFDCENDLRTAQLPGVIHSGILHPKSTNLFVCKNSVLNSDLLRIQKLADSKQGGVLKTKEIPNIRVKYSAIIYF